MDKILNTRACLSQAEVQGYLDNDLSEDQRFDIENHLLDCPLCEAALEGFATADPQKAAKHLEQIKAAIPELAKSSDRSLDESKRKATIKRLPTSKRFNWIAAAAAIGLLLLASLLYRQLGDKSPEQLFAASYQTYDSPFAGTRASSDNESALSLGIAAYQEGNYSEALAALERSEALADDQFIAHFHAGLAALQLNDLQKAQKYLELTRINATALYDPASWYLALAHLKANELQRCAAILSQIKPTDKEYYPKAQRLLRQLQGAKE